MQKDKHPKFKIIKAIHTDGTSYDIISTIKSSEIKISSSKERYPWKDLGVNTYVKNAKTEKYNIYKDIK